MTIPVLARYSAMLLVTLTTASAARGQPRPNGFIVPKAIGYVNDYADVIPETTRRSLADSILQLKNRTDGDVVVVTRPTLEGLDPSDMARRIGNTWGVGANSRRARQVGTIVLVIPKETSTDGRGYCRIELGVGANAFIPDSVAASMCIAATPAFRARRYGEAVQGIVLALAKQYDAALR